MAGREKQIITLNNILDYPKRREIYEMAKEPMNFTNLKVKTNSSSASLEYHLKILEKFGLIKRERIIIEGKGKQGGAGLISSIEEFRLQVLYSGLEYFKKNKSKGYPFLEIEDIKNKEDLEIILKKLQKEQKEKNATQNFFINTVATSMKMSFDEVCDIVEDYIDNNNSF